jgi:hypothetical protein
LTHSLSFEEMELLLQVGWVVKHAGHADKARAIAELADRLSTPRGEATNGQ